MIEVFKTVHKYYDINAAVKLNFNMFSTAILEVININCQKYKQLYLTKVFLFLLTNTDLMKMLHYNCYAELLTGTGGAPK